jgi:hypothetical protein
MRRRKSTETLGKNQSSHALIKRNKSIESLERKSPQTIKGNKSTESLRQKRNESSGSLGKKIHGSLQLLSGFRRASTKHREYEEEGHTSNARWDNDQELRGSPEIKKIPGPLKRWNPLFLRTSANSKNNHNSILEEDKPYRRSFGDFSGLIEEAPKSPALRRWSYDKNRKDDDLLKSPKLEQVLLNRNNRRGRRSGIKKKLMGQQQQHQHQQQQDDYHKRNSSNSNSAILDKTERSDSTGDRSSCDVIPSHSQRGSGNDSSYNNNNNNNSKADDCLGMSINSSVAPAHNLKDEEVVLLLFRELASMGQ